MIKPWQPAELWVWTGLEIDMSDSPGSAYYTKEAGGIRWLEKIEEESKRGEGEMTGGNEQRMLILETLVTFTGHIILGKIGHHVKNNSSFELQDLKKSLLLRVL